MIRVILERRVADDMEGLLQEVLRDIRQEAIHFPGYISGETWRDATNPHHHIVISTWHSKTDWDAWMASDGRARHHVKVDPLLDEPEKITVLEPL